MTREDIICMAREAEDYADTIYEKGEYHPGWVEVRDQRFAALVAAAALTKPEPKETFADSLARRSWEAHRAALAEPYPVAWMESPHGAIRANPLYRITVPQSLVWSIPLYTHLPAAAKPEPATDEQVAEAYKASENDENYWLDYPDGWRDAERFHGIRGGNGTTA